LGAKLNQSYCFHATSTLPKRRQFTYRTLKAFFSQVKNHLKALESTQFTRQVIKRSKIRSAVLLLNPSEASKQQAQLSKQWLKNTTGHDVKIPWAVNNG